jgi:hypothetical protein
MADPFGFIGNTLQSAYLPNTEDEEARKYREEYERMRRTLQAEGKPAPPPVYQTRKPKNVFGGLLPEYGAGNLAKKRQAEQAAWRQSYDPVAMKRFQDQRKRDELQRDIGKRRQLEQVGGKAGQTPSMTPAFTKAAQEGGWSPSELSVLAKRGDSGYRARTEGEESELERLMFEQAGGISASAAAQQARARTPAVKSEQQYVNNYWDAMNRGRIWNSAVDKQESQNKFTKAYNDIKLNFERETASDKILLSKVAAMYAGLKRKSYEQSPQAHIDAITGVASKTATEAAEFIDPAAATSRAGIRDAKTAAMAKSALESRDFVDWFNKQDPKEFPPGFLSAQDWRRVEAMIRAYGQRAGGSGAEYAEALRAFMEASAARHDTSFGNGTSGSPRPGTSYNIPANIPLP